MADTDKVLEQIVDRLKALDGQLGLLRAGVLELAEQHRGAIESVHRFGQRCPNLAQLIVNNAARHATPEPAEPITTTNLKARYAPIVTAGRKR
jgi:hypothetical protein